MNVLVNKHLTLLQSAVLCAVYGALCCTTATQADSIGKDV